MLRKFIKSIIPSKGDIFFILFEEEAITAHECAKIFIDSLASESETDFNRINSALRILKQKSNDLHKKILLQLNNMFITPIDRGDIQELSVLFNKLSKRIVKLSTKLQIYNIDAKIDDCLIKNATTLLVITKTLVDSVQGLRLADNDKITIADDKINELEENGIEDFRQAINEMYSGKFDTLTILKLKEIYKSIDGAIDLSVSAADLVRQISLKNI